MMVITCRKIVDMRLFSFIHYGCETVNMYTIFAVSILAHLQNLRFLYLFLSFLAFYMFHQLPPLPQNSTLVLLDRDRSVYGEHEFFALIN